MVWNRAHTGERRTRRRISRAYPPSIRIDRLPGFAWEAAPIEPRSFAFRPPIGTDDEPWDSFRIIRRAGKRRQPERGALRSREAALRPIEYGGDQIAQSRIVHPNPCGFVPGTCRKVTPIGSKRNRSYRTAMTFQHE